jgi:DNA-binding NarL/FixJ family response regulator
MGTGVYGFVLKRAIATDLFDAVAAVLGGHPFISPGIRARGPAKPLGDL